MIFCDVVNEIITVRTVLPWLALSLGEFGLFGLCLRITHYVTAFALIVCCRMEITHPKEWEPLSAPLPEQKGCLTHHLWVENNGCVYNRNKIYLLETWYCQDITGLQMISRSFNIDRYHHASIQTSNIMNMMVSRHLDELCRNWRAKWHKSIYPEWHLRFMNDLKGLK